METLCWQEYLEALHLLKCDTHLEIRDRQINCVVLILAYRFGLRISEACGIRRKDLLGELDNLVVRVSNDEFRKVKTDAGLRHVPLLGRLTELEHSILSDWLTHIDHCLPDDRLKGLFAERDHGRRLVSQWRVASRIRDALRVVTGDPRARIHYCRHTFGTRFSFLLGNDDRKIESVQLRDALGAADGTLADDLKETLIDRTSTSRRGQWALASIIGHAYAGTTARYYAHLDDMALAMTAGAVLDTPLNEKQLLNLLGVKSRPASISGDSEGEELTETIRRKIGAESVSNLVMDRQPLSLPPPDYKQEREIAMNLQDVFRVFQAAIPDARIENLSALLLIEPDTVKQVLAEASAVAEETEFCSVEEKQTGFIIPDPAALTVNEWRRLIMAAKGQKKKKGFDAGLMREAAKIWKAGFSPSRGLLLLREGREEDMRTLATFLQSAGIGLDRMRLYVQENDIQSQWCKTYLKMAKEMNFVHENVKRLPPYPGSTYGKRRRPLEIGRVAFVITESGEGNIRSTKAAMRFLLGVATYASMECGQPAGELA